MSAETPSQSSLPDGSTDSGLIKGVSDQRESAWSSFVEVYSGLIYVWCRKLDLQPSDALDVSQLVFQSVHRAIDQYSATSNRGSFRAWLFTITKNHTLNYLTRTLKGPNARGGSSIQVQLLNKPDSISEESISSSKISSEVEGIASILERVESEYEPNTWKCFWLMAMEQHSAAEVAELLDMRPAAVRQAKYRITKRLKQELKDFF